MAILGFLALAAGIVTTLYFTLRDKTEAVAAGDIPANIGDTSPAPVVVATGDLDSRIQRFAQAIASAEGFGVKGAIPTIYHNPGDLKPPDGSNNFWTGQVGVGNGGHAIFDSDASGFAALYRQIRLWQIGKSSVIFPYFTFTQAAQKYAESWQPWLANVTRILGVRPTDTLGDYFNGTL
jgi:hypothetical protein